MAIKLNPGRQEVISARVVASLGTGNDVSAVGVYPAISLPAGAVVVGGDLVVTDATTATVDLSVGDATVVDRYLADADGGATGRSALVPTGFVYSVPTNITLDVSTAAAAAEGEVVLTVQYIVVGRAAFSQD